MNQETINILIGVSLVIISGIVVAINANRVNNPIKKFEAWIRRTQPNVYSSWFYRYIIKPIFRTIVVMVAFSIAYCIVIFCIVFGIIFLILYGIDKSMNKEEKVGRIDDNGNIYMKKR